MRAKKFTKTGAIITVMAAVWGMLIHGTRAANIIWSEPAIISGEADVATLGTLDRAYNLGSTGKVVTVNGVSFTPFATKATGDEFSDGRTTLAVSGDGDGLATAATLPGSGLTGFTPDYRAILQSSVLDQGSAMALALDGLTIGSTYLFQSWSYHPQSQPWTVNLTGGDNTSAAVKYNSTENFSGLGQSVIGTFTADATRQLITYTPNGGPAQINAFQLRVMADTASVVILKQPSSATNFPTQSTCLSIFALGQPPLTYQWQKVASTGVVNVTDGEGILGATTNTLRFDLLTSDDAGAYWVVVTGPSGSATSQTAAVVVMQPSTNQLINVAVSDGTPAAYQGMAVLAGNRRDVWNSPDARSSFTNAALLDSAGKTTPVILTVLKPDGAVLRNRLLGAVCFATEQTVTLSQLEPNALYDLVVFSVGNMVNEGGVFAGALNGISHGDGAPEKATGGFIYGTNFVENPFALSDAQGRLTFTIKPTATVTPDGWQNCDFNGLQLMKVPNGDSPPVILQSPASLISYTGHPVTLTAISASPPSLSTTCQWQKITAAGTINLVDGNGLSGTTTPALAFNSLAMAQVGAYQVVVANSAGAVTSRVANITVPANQAINVAVNNGSTPPHMGAALLAGTPKDVWNSPDARTGFEKFPLVDAAGLATPVTLTLAKPDGGSVRNSLLGNVSFASRQEITMEHLEPNALYELIVFSVGNIANEGGVFSGAINGLTRGFPINDVVATNFFYGTNYLNNPYALSDARGQISFTILPTSTVIPNGHTFGDFNGLQLKPATSDLHLPVILQPPLSTKGYLHHSLRLSVMAISPPALPLQYQWQKVSGAVISDLTNAADLSGSTTHALNFSPFQADHAGGYRVVITSSSGSVTSAVAIVTGLANQLINVAVNNGSTQPRVGNAVLAGADDDVWNSPDARNSFGDVLLVDSKGILTPVSLTLSKTNGSAVRNSLLGNVSFASWQTVTVKHLSPNQPYDLVVFSVGNMMNEGGVFSGAITGLTRGYPVNNVTATNFVVGTNYVRNPHALADAQGTLSFTVLPTSTAIPNGHTFGDFNGLQLREWLPEDAEYDRPTKIH